MTPEQLRDMMSYLSQRVRLGEDGRSVVFSRPDPEEMITAGLDSDGSRRLLGAPWLEEMIEDVVETPEFCEPSDSGEQVLRYARDVVIEYIRKRFTLEESS